MDVEINELALELPQSVPVNHMRSDTCLARSGRFGAVWILEKLVVVRIICEFTMDIRVEEIWGVLTEEERKGAGVLVEAGQTHLFGKWVSGKDEAGKRKLLKQAAELDAQYPGGLKQYVANSKKLLEESRMGVNPFDGYTPSVPVGERLLAGTTEFGTMEDAGLAASRETGFVLVAGGLGERLGYKGIKIALPCEITTGKTFIQLYVEHILAFQERARRATGNPDLVLPLAIMTSGDTHDATVKLLSEHKDFGMAEGQITLMKQEKVPALEDNEGRFALEESDPFEISTKPHGHGDVHTLMFQKGLVKKWTTMGIKWIVFFQDTNGVVFRAIPAALGVSKTRDFDVNSLTVARKPGEPVGAICKLVHSSGSTLTINVEYNQLDSLLRATVNPDGDTADPATGFSPYPGNINVLVFKAESYLTTLERTHGGIPEFVNPKYADASKTKFKKPTRLECMMQDYPKLLDSSAKVGFTQLERWLSFSAVKNSLDEAAKKFKETGFAESASSGEFDMYFINRKLLALGKSVEFVGPVVDSVVAGLPVAGGAKVVLTPSFGVTQKEIASKLSQAAIRITPRSTLVLDGEDIEVRSLDLDGALIVHAAKGSKVVIDKLTAKNAGHEFKVIDPADTSIDQKYRIRAYVLDKKDEAVYSFADGKDHILASAL